MEKGNKVFGTTIIKGCEVDYRMLADWIWQGIRHMEDEYLQNPRSERGEYLKLVMKKALFVHYTLIGCSAKEAKEHIVSFL